MSKCLSDKRKLRRGFGRGSTAGLCAQPMAKSWAVSLSAGISPKRKKRNSFEPGKVESSN